MGLFCLRIMGFVWVGCWETFGFFSFIFSLILVFLGFWVRGEWFLVKLRSFLRDEVCFFYFYIR